MKKYFIAIAITLAMVLGIAGCGSPDASVPSNGYVPVGGTPPVTSAPDMSPVASAPDTPASDPEPTVTPEKPAEPPTQPDDVDVPEPDAEIDTRTEDEKLADYILEVCSTQATVETSASACVVDVRTAVNPYDVTWDYGIDYTHLSLSGMNIEIWDTIFDVEYYKNTFPILAMLYHNNTSFLYTHFTTVGVHEGRQGSENFNVKAFMETCPDWVREKFNDNYACYYLYYVNSNEVDRNADYSGKGYPKQMTAVMTAVQAEELRNINAERERLGVEPLVFDSELAAFANYRCWINAAENYAAHDWAKQNNDVLWDVVGILGGDTISENTTSRFKKYFNAWYYGYAGSESHYNAMTNTKFGFVGNSNVYACDNTLEQYKNYKATTRLVHFDIFMGTLDTALNHK